MRNVSLLMCLLAVLLSTVGTAASVAAAPTTQRVFVAELAGEEEVPPVDTDAQGRAVFRLSPDGTRLEYKLTAHIRNAFAAHIHVGPKGVNGPVVAFLFPAPNGSCEVRRNHLRCVGTITAENLLDRLRGHPLSDLIREMEAGNTYTNIHTPPHPGGEIRGHIESRDDGGFDAEPAD